MADGISTLERDANRPSPHEERRSSPLKTSKPVNRVVWYSAAALLFTFALAKFVFMDFRELKYPTNDLTLPWILSQVFMHGHNPYTNIDDAAAVWASAGISPAESCDYNCVLSYFGRIQPPTSLLLVAPLGLTPWRTAVYVSLVGSLILYVLGLLLLARNLSMRWRDPRFLFFIAFALAMAPLHTGLHVSNLSTMTVACILIGVALLPNKPYVSGIAFAIAMCLKPQVVIFFFAWLWLKKKWKATFAALGTCAAITGASLAWLRIHHIAWFQSYLNELSRCSSTGVGCSFYAPDPDRFQLVNLQVLMFQLTKNVSWANVLSWGLFALLLGLAIFLIHARASGRNQGAELAIISVLTLLPVYQRYYTAAILVFVVYWAVENWPDWNAKAALLCMLPLLLPLASIADQSDLVSSFVRAHALDENPVWNVVFMPHAIWIELILLLLILAGLCRLPARPELATDDRPLRSL